ncbi:unannotated protein [freshwater metagenome]|uniref:L-threonylcarbamoyladenylate synthase n=1 Tax=freshwater metagenome TaxID=449393 RepID=A0A6J7XRE1_9ZZZZ|nr:hypothetical protein [Actinomycetota bacterium]
MGALVYLYMGERSDHVEQAVKAIRDGYIIIAPLENSYVYLCDAFSHDAVRAMHVLRKDPLGVAAQVLVGNLEMAKGIIRGVPPIVEPLMVNFWPGLLTLNLRPQIGLTWDLGDDNELDLVSVRVPVAPFVLEVLQQSGPLAVASASPVGRPPLLNTREITAREGDIAAIFGDGVLQGGTPTTILEVSDGGVRMVREGAITREELMTASPFIFPTNQ